MHRVKSSSRSFNNNYTSLLAAGANVALWLLVHMVCWTPIAILKWRRLIASICLVMLIATRKPCNSCTILFYNSPPFALSHSELHIQRVWNMIVVVPGHPSPMHFHASILNVTHASWHVSSTLLLFSLPSLLSSFSRKRAGKAGVRATKGERR